VGLTGRGARHDRGALRGAVAHRVRAPATAVAATAQQVRSADTGDHGEDEKDRGAASRVRGGHVASPSPLWDVLIDMRSLALALAVVFIAPAAARADTLLTPVTGAQHVTAAGNTIAWAAPEGGRYRLVIDGATTPIPSFASAPAADLGSNAFTGQHVVAVYSRCAGGDCDVYLYDPQTQSARKVRGASSNAYSETAPSIANGNIAFVRRGGRHDGVYVLRLRSGRLHRVDGHLARETAVSQSRVAFLYRNSKGADDITISQLDGAKRRLLRRAGQGVLFSLQITRYKVGWLEHADTAVVARLTRRINPSDARPFVSTGKRTLPATTTSAAIAHDRQFDVYADAEGVKRIAPPLFAG
jgi:hypothetical protein